MNIVGDIMLVSFEFRRPGTKQYIRAYEELEKIGFHRQIRDEKGHEWSHDLPPNTVARVTQCRGTPREHDKLVDDIMEEVGRAFAKMRP